MGEKTVDLASDECDVATGLVVQRYDLDVGNAQRF